MEKSEHPYKKHFSDVLLDIWCVVSVIGIWPRFIEPTLLETTKLNLKIPDLPPQLAGLKILQFSDIHLHSGVPQYFLDKLVARIKKTAPDIIVFTGDFLCYSKLRDKERLRNLLCTLSAPYGCYAILGNHDYQQTVSINDKGEYDVMENQTSMVGKAFSRLFSTITLAKVTTERAKKVDANRELEDLLKETPFELLHNKTRKIEIKGTCLNICGLGEYTLGRCLPAIAFKGYDKNYPGIILAHNPDSFPLLKDYPGNIVLSGHTHGGQINLPWLWKKFTLLEDMRFKKGLFQINGKWAYISRGIGGVMPFRFFAVPEIVLMTLEKP